MTPPFIDQGAEASRLDRIDARFRVGEQVGSRLVQHVTEKNLGVAARIIELAGERAQGFLRGGQEVADGIG